MAIPKESPSTPRMISARMLRVANDAAGTVGVVLFEHRFTDGCRYSVQSAPVNSSRSDFMTEQVKNTMVEAEEAYDELLSCLSHQVGPLKSREAPVGFNTHVYGPH